MEIKCKNVAYQDPLLDYQDSILDITYTFHNDQIYGVIGPSGSGKTTLLELLSKEKIPSSGMIQLGSEKKCMPSRNIGYLHQNLEHQFIGLTVEEELDYLLESFSYRLKEKNKRIKEVLIMVGLDDSYLNRKIETLSHGVCDSICVLYQGTIYLEGNKYEVFANEEQLKQIHMKVPQIISFSNLVYKRTKINIGYRDDMNDLMKDVYRYVK